jgi:hypothetical protein
MHSPSDSRERGGRMPVQVILFALLLLTAWTYLPRDFSLGGGGSWMCIDYVAEGTLYGGQPYCTQGPVIYYVFYLFSIVFGGSTQAMLAISWAVILGFHALNYLIVRRILIHHRAYHPEATAFLYILMVFRFMNDLNSNLAAGFFLPGFYVLYYSRIPYRGLAAGVLFSLAAFTKYTTLIPITLAVAYHLLKHNITIQMTPGLRGSIRLSYHIDLGSITDAVLVAVVLLASFFIFDHAYAYFIEYTITVQTGQLPSDVGGGIGKILGDRSLTTAIAAVIVSAVLYSLARGFFGRDELIYPLTILAILPYGIIFYLWQGRILLGTHYLLPIYPLMLVAYLLVRERSPKLFTMLVVVTVVYPSIYGSPFLDAARGGFDRGDAESVKAMEYGIHFIPPQSGFALIEGPSGYEGIFAKYGAPVETSKVTRIRTDERGYPTHEDPVGGPMLRKLVNISSAYSQAYDGLTVEELAIQDEILSGKYSLIISGPPSWAATTRILNNVTPYLRENYCGVFIPNFLYRGTGLSFYTLLFKDPEDCARMIADSAAYYNDNFDKFCLMGGGAGNIVKQVVNYNIQSLGGAGASTQPITYACTSEGPYMYVQSDRDRATWMDLAAAVLACIISYLAFLMLGWVKKAEKVAEGRV